MTTDYYKKSTRLEMLLDDLSDYCEDDSDYCDESEYNQQEIQDLRDFNQILYSMEE